MKILITCLTCLFIMHSALAQEFEVPVGYEFKSKQDYIKYRKEIIEASKWLQSTPLDINSKKRKEISIFVASYVNGNPFFNVDVSQTIIEIEKKNPGMLMLYLAGNARFVLENNYSQDKISMEKAALKGMIDMYVKGIGIQKDKNMERLVRADDKGKMDQWIDENIKIEKRD
ncbi:MAG: hypothetical protein ACJ748_00100 [Flavisolibacter sp.]